jgi:ParB family chromosome partitioning protein
MTDFTKVNIKQISLDSIRYTSKHNVRKLNEVGDKSISQLADSIKAVGLLHPIIVRPIIDGSNESYELLVGTRRLGAVMVLGYKVIDAKIIEVDDQQAAIIIATENLQREDLTPFEEAESLELLLEENPDVKAIASNLGRSPQWVARRAKLLNLTPEWRTAATREYEHWSAGHFELIARYDPETQAEFLEDFEGTYIENMSVDALEKELNEKMRYIKKVPWKPDDDSLIPEVGACTVCSKRSSCQSLLFEPEDIGENDIKKDDKCLDVKCWDRKLKAHVDRQAYFYEKKHPNLIKIRSDYHTNDDYENALSPSDYDNAKMKHTDSVPAIVVSGPGAGEKRWVIPHGSTPKSNTRPKDKNGKAVPLTIDERLGKLQHRRNAWIVNKALDLIGKVNFKGNSYQIISMVAVFGTNKRNDTFGYGDGWKEFDKLTKIYKSWKHDETIKDYVQLLWSKTKGVFFPRLNFQTAADATERIPEVKRLCELTYIDFDKLVTQSETEIPVPKVLAAELAKQEKKKPEKTNEHAIAEKKPTANRTRKAVAVDLEKALQELESRSGDRFSDTAAFREGNKIKVVYNQFPTLPDRFSLLTRLQGEQYLNWLDGVNIGTYEDMKMN